MKECNFIGCDRCSDHHLSVAEVLESTSVAEVLESVASVGHILCVGRGARDSEGQGTSGDLLRSPRGAFRSG